MYPILFSIGRIHLFSFSVFLIVAWLVFSFVFWKLLRNQAIDEEHIFDLTFYSSLVAFVFSRAAFVVFHWSLFADSWLKVFALWVQPGLSLYGALVGGMLTMLYLSRRFNIRVAHVLDGLGFAFPAACVAGLIGTFLDGTTVGKLTSVAWSVRYVGHVGRRHPVQVYELVALICIIIFVSIMQKKAAKKSWPYGAAGLWFFLVYSVVQFVLEFVKESGVYFLGLSANQWVLIALFAETLGAFYVRGGGREVIRPMIRRASSRVVHGIGGIYAKLSRKSP